MKKIILILIILVMSPSFSFAILPTAKITFKVIDTNGEPVSGARIHVYFPVPKYSEPGLTTKTEIGKTNKNGLFATSKSSIGRVAASVSKEGYYESGGGLEFKTSENYFVFKRWIPWNPTIELVLREKINPVKMYSKHLQHKKFPVQNQEVGYDLVKGDWVPPYGKGEQGDFIFIFSHRYTTNEDWDSKYELKFSNKEDGLQIYEFSPDINSVFKWPYLAPEKGYNIKQLKKYSIFLADDDYSTKTVRTNIKKNINYIFRVRTKTNGKGEVIGGLYGIMPSDMYVKGELYNFEYKLNPINRSLEYEVNLFDTKY